MDPASVELSSRDKVVRRIGAVLKKLVQKSFCAYTENETFDFELLDERFVHESSSFVHLDELLNAHEIDGVVRDFAAVTMESDGQRKLRAIQFGPPLVAARDIQRTSIGNKRSREHEVNDTHVKRQRTESCQGCSEYAVRLKTARNENDRLQNARSEAEVKYAALARRLAEAEYELQNNASHAVEADTNNNLLQDELAEATRERNELHESVETLTRKRDELHESVEILTRDVFVQNDTCATLREQLANANALCDESKLKISELTDQLRERDAELELANRQCTEMETQLNTSIVDNATIGARHSEELNEMKIKHDQREIELAARLAEMERLITEQTREFEMRLNTTQQQHAVTLREKDEYIARLTREQNDTIARDAERANQRMQALQENERLSVGIRDIMRRLEELQPNITESFGASSMMSESESQSSATPVSIVAVTPDTIDSIQSMYNSAPLHAGVGVNMAMLQPHADNHFVHDMNSTPMHNAPSGFSLSMNGSCQGSVMNDQEFVAMAQQFFNPSNSAPPLPVVPAKEPQQTLTGAPAKEPQPALARVRKAFFGQLVTPHRWNM